MLDSGDSLGETAAALADLESRHAGLAVIVVADNPGASRQTLQMVLRPKWERLDELVEEIESVYTRRRRPSPSGVAT